MISPKMTIGGQAVNGSETFDVINPSLGEVFAQAPACTRDELDQAMLAAAGAFQEWHANEKQRREILRSASSALTAASDELARLLTAEQGKPLADSTGEIAVASRCLAYFADLELCQEVVQSDSAAFTTIDHRPLGVVAAIAPWNYPIALAMWKMAPALAAGNTLVLKPSPFTPLASLRMGAILNDVLPPGTLNVVSGGDELGSWMTAHPVPRKISFTGSIATGKTVALAAAADLKRLTLELGGNDPAIVLDDVDAETIADKLFWAAFANNGQICKAVKRVYVHERRYSQVVDALVARARAVKIGDGFAPGVQLGPINNERQRTRVHELVADAIRAGGRVAAGGHTLDRAGYFYAPTIVDHVPDGTRLVEEEQFGPALPVLPYSTIEDVVRRANRTHFGLGASIWTSDEERGVVVANQLESGTVWINAHGAIGQNQPFGGHKWSGIGVENGPWGLREFTEMRVVYRNRAAMQVSK
jgi:acyl-CoA reductase-like NAD-dependent aldehyde dehydrogenase